MIVVTAMGTTARLKQNCCQGAGVSTGTPRVGGCGGGGETDHGDEKNREVQVRDRVAIIPLKAGISQILGVP